MKLYYSINCEKDCEYYSNEHLEEKWKDAMLYGKPIDNYQVSNFGGITKNGRNINRFLNTRGEICIELDGYKDGIELYKIVASTYLTPPSDGYYEVIDGKEKAKSVHHRDNNSYNFNPDNLIFLNGSIHLSKETPHLNLSNIVEWNNLIERICKK